MDTHKANELRKRRENFVVAARCGLRRPDYRVLRVVVIYGAFKLDGDGTRRGRASIGPSDCVATYSELLVLRGRGERFGRFGVRHDDEARIGGRGKIRCALRIGDSALPGDRINRYAGERDASRTIQVATVIGRPGDIGRCTNCGDIPFEDRDGERDHVRCDGRFRDLHPACGKKIVSRASAVAGDARIEFGDRTVRGNY